MGGVPSGGLCHFGMVPLASTTEFLTSPTLQGNLHPTFLLILYFRETARHTLEQLWDIPIVTRAKKTKAFTLKCWIP